jgi:hypothetical protein
VYVGSKMPTEGLKPNVNRAARSAIRVKFWRSVANAPFSRSRTGAEVSQSSKLIFWRPNHEAGADGWTVDAGVTVES